MVVVGREIGGHGCRLLLLACPWPESLCRPAEFILRLDTIHHRTDSTSQLRGFYLSSSSTTPRTHAVLSTLSSRGPLFPPPTAMPKHFNHCPH
ncbi:hypothetical protein PGIGA_G00106910 [Pangasianodon gigas]|uniref:Uncharacterized protein n=1 Tax=Pangasianodon gigas TaxID=30993 RepID=A0ACC5W932_PANGG|nr:hypothetical protein [Pangasianodon gigas]